MNKEEVAKLIDHSLLHPTLTDKELTEGCLLAKKYNVASVCIKPYAVKLAVSLLNKTDVLICTVIGFPHGNSTIEVKQFEAEIACQDGATELDMVVNIGKVLSEDWTYIKQEIDSILEIALKYNAILKVIFENDFLPDDKYKIKLCQICNELKVHFVKTSTGYGYVKGNDGKYSYQGATDHDLMLMRMYSDKKIQVKAAGGVRTIDDVKRVVKLGVTRIGASATEKIIQEINELD